MLKYVSYFSHKKKLSLSSKIVTFRVYVKDNMLKYVSYFSHKKKLSLSSKIVTFRVYVKVYCWRKIRPILSVCHLLNLPIEW